MCWQHLLPPPHTLLLTLLPQLLPKQSRYRRSQKMALCLHSQIVLHTTMKKHLLQPSLPVFSKDKQHSRIFLYNLWQQLLLELVRVYRKSVADDNLLYLYGRQQCRHYYKHVLYCLRCFQLYIRNKRLRSSKGRRWNLVKQFKYGIFPICLCK